MANPTDTQRNLAVFVDFENLALGFQDRTGAFQMSRVLDRLLEKGKVIVKLAYSDWSRFRKYTDQLHEAGVILIEIPKRGLTGKNSADIRLVVDAMELCHTKDHIDTFVIVSGDSDFSPLVGKLKENGKHVIGVGMRASTSNLLADNCDEFLFYEDIVAPEVPLGGGNRSIPNDKQEAWQLLFETLRALQREGTDVLYASLIKDTMRRKRPSFSESSYGYESFGEMLEEVRDADFIDLREDERSGTWVVSALKSSRSRKRSGKRGSGSTKKKSSARKKTPGKRG
ncbi:hypothetical protein DRQ53_01800 [bacterium]|nr:MAG: hypothetical protein DRQ32_09270 [bacterium]RKZ18021.1 MAG: hypothetical protein DRQ53_01800 [bacterium]